MEWCILLVNLKDLVQAAQIASGVGSEGLGSIQLDKDDCCLVDHEYCAKSEFRL